MSESSYDEHDHDHEEDATHFSTCHCSDPHTKPAAAPLAAVDYKQTNKDHHNAPGHAHNHSNSALNQWTARKCAETILRSYTFEEETTTMLDFACGGGLVSQELASHCKRIVGVDISTAMVDQFNLQVSNQGIDASEMVAVQRDTLLDEESELDGELFDVVICAQAYHHIPDVNAITLALSRRLKPNGVLLIIDLDLDSGFGEAISGRMLSDQAERFRKVVAHKGGFSRKGLQAVLEKTERFSEVTVETSHTMRTYEMKALEGDHNWAQGVMGPDLEIIAIVARGVRK